jgi:hypothetical protein
MHKLKIALKHFNYMHGFRIGVEERYLPALRTVHAVLPHTALQKSSSSTGLSIRGPGSIQGEEPGSSKEVVWPFTSISFGVTKPWSFLLLSQYRTQPTANVSI